MDLRSPPSAFRLRTEVERVAGETPQASDGDAFPKRVRVEARIFPQDAAAGRAQGAGQLTPPASGESRHNSRCYHSGSRSAPGRVPS